MKCSHQKKRKHSEAFSHIETWIKRNKPSTYQRILKKINPNSSEDKLIKMFEFIKKGNDSYQSYLKQKDFQIDWSVFQTRIEQPSFYSQFFQVVKRELQEQLQILVSTKSQFKSNASFIVTSLERSSDVDEYGDYLDQIENLYHRDPSLVLKQSSLLSRIRRTYYHTKYDIDEFKYVENYFRIHLSPILFAGETMEMKQNSHVQLEEVSVDWLPNVLEIVDLLLYGAVNIERKIVRVAVIAMGNLPPKMFHAMVSSMFEARLPHDSIEHTWRFLFGALLLGIRGTLEYDIIFRIVASSFAYCLSLNSCSLGHLVQPSTYAAFIMRGKSVKESLVCFGDLLEEMRKLFLSEIE